MYFASKAIFSWEPALYSLGSWVWGIEWRCLKSWGGDSSVGVSLGVVTVGAMTGRVKRLDGGDSEGGDCWGSREVEINTIIR